MTEDVEGVGERPLQIRVDRLAVDHVARVVVPVLGTDCRHREEPKCAVKSAVEAGDLPANRLQSYHKLQDELAFLARQQDERMQIEEKRRNKVMGKALKEHLRTKR